jgi:hypothetical protein
MKKERAEIKWKCGGNMSNFLTQKIDYQPYHHLLYTHQQNLHRYHATTQLERWFWPLETPVELPLKFPYAFFVCK